MRARPQRRVRRTRPSRAVAVPDRAIPPTWRVWQARNGGRHWYWRAPLAVEWGLEWFVYRLRSLALFDLKKSGGAGTSGGSPIAPHSPHDESGKVSARFLGRLASRSFTEG